MRAARKSSPDDNMRDDASPQGLLIQTEPQAVPRRKLRWYLNRLRCMSPAELPFRMLRLVSAHIEQLAPSPRGTPAPDLSLLTPPWIQPGADFDVPRYLAAADAIVAGKLDVFALHGIDVGSPPHWNRDPRTSIEAPLRFGKLLDYRDTALVGDIKYLWEPNRHLHLVTLAQAHALSHDTRYAQTLAVHLRSWFASCPYPFGANWSSALEAGIRLINWSVAWQLLGGAQSPLFADAAGAALRTQWLRSVYQHAAFIRGFFSGHSSANNHLIGEAAGLFVAANTWPCWPEASGWRADSLAILSREILLQNAADGVNLEQTTGYQQFVLDLLLMAWLSGRANDVRFPDSFGARLEAMLEYLASIMDSRGHVPQFGDSDDGTVVQLSQEAGFCAFRSLLASGAVLFDRADFRAKAGHLDDKTRWLLGPASVAGFSHATSGSGALPVRRCFPEGGYYVLGCDFETDREIRIVADAGPLGYGAIAAHGHADALSFTLCVGGREVFVDPGTYTYRTDSPWRGYFRGTSAHNTLRIDGQDQSESGGTFMWLHKAAAHCTTWRSSAETDCLEGSHNGYRRLADPVTHRRRITLDKPQRRILLEDRLEMAGTHLVELHFHCHEASQLRRQPDAHLLELDGLALQIQLPDVAGAEVQVCSGQMNPPLGWVSRHFDVRVAAPTLVWRARLTGPTRLCTVIQC
jgi:hypothetical protein